MSVQAKKSVYILLCALLGSLLFLVLHRILIFGYLLLLTYKYDQFSFGLSFLEFLALDYTTLIVTLIAGMWYGIWLGIYWYESVYEGEHSGFVGHMVRRYWPTRTEVHNLRSKIALAEQDLSRSAWELEGMAKRVEQVSKNEIKSSKRIVRKKTAK